MAEARPNTRKSIAFHLPASIVHNNLKIAHFGSHRWLAAKSLKMGYLPDSGSPYRLWFRFGVGSGVKNPNKGTKLDVESLWGYKLLPRGRVLPASTHIVSSWPN